MQMTLHTNTVNRGFFLEQTTDMLHIIIKPITRQNIVVIQKQPRIRISL